MAAATGLATVTAVGGLAPATANAVQAAATGYYASASEHIY